jgi:hypothetical protein
MAPPPLAELFADMIEFDAGALDARRLPTHGGVYVIADAERRPILLAACEDLRRVVPARLTAPVEGRSKRTNLAEVARSVWWTPTFSPFETALRYHAVVRRLYPKDYRKRLGFGPAWFLRGDPREPIPRIAVVKEYPPDGARYVGPFATRAEAEATIQVVEDLFDLCRKYDILRQVPHGKPCEYWEMGKCPAPCDGRVPMAQYRTAIGRAMNFVAGDREPIFAELDEGMRAAAKGLQFERAAALKRSIEQARQHVGHERMRWVADLRDFRWLIIQRAGPRSRSAKKLLLKPFFVTGGAIREGEAAPLAELEAVAPKWLDASNWLEDAAVGDVAEWSERMWCVWHFVAKGDKATGRFCRANRLPTGTELISYAEQQFTRSSVASDEAAGAASPQPSGGLP